MQPVPERSDLRADGLPAELLRQDRPVVLRGLVAHWPMVQAARRSDAAFAEHLLAFGGRQRVGYWRGAPSIGGRFFYGEAFDDLNFERAYGAFDALLQELLASADLTEPPALYLGSTELDGTLPGLRQANPLALGVADDPLVSLWLGNRARVAAHFDLPDNLACVVAGRRRFTLFPPEQLANLYVGPLDFTPAGQAISLVDVAAPDLARFPRYAMAQAQALVAELEPGDALFLPSMWWHAVESLAPLNGLVNFWWRQSPPYMDTPLNTLMLALLTLRDLPPAQRAAWRTQFEHYVFAPDEAVAAHIPPAARGVLGPITDARARQLRAHLLNRLNR